MWTGLNWDLFVSRQLLVDRGRITKQISLFVGTRKQTQNRNVFHFASKTVWSIATASGLSTACSMLVTRQHRKIYHHSSTCPRHNYVPHDEAHSADRVQECRQLVAVSLRCRPACVQEAICEPVNAICTGSSPLLESWIHTITRLEVHAILARRAGLQNFHGVTTADRPYLTGSHGIWTPVMTVTYEILINPMWKFPGSAPVTSVVHIEQLTSCVCVCACVSGQ